MQVSFPMSSVATLTGASLVDQVKRQAAALADDSGASNAAKIDAYLSISKAVAQSASTGSGWFQQSTQADRDAVNAVMDNSAMAKQVRQAADDFNARGLRAARTGNVMADQLSYLEGQSETQQKMIFSGTASLDQTASLDSWKDFLRQQSDARDQQLAAETSSTPTVKVTLSEKARAIIGQSLGSAETETAIAPSVDLLAKTDNGDGIAGAALKMLQKAAEDRAAASDEEAKRRAQTSNRTYEAGDRIYTSI